MSHIGKPATQTAKSGAATGTYEKPTKTRWWMLFLIGLFYMISYIDRGNISVAAPEIMKDFHITKTSMGLALSVFAVAYAIGQVPGGWLADRFGPRKVLTAIGWGVGIAPILNGLAVGMNSLVGARLFLGLAEAGGFPVSTRGMQMWFARSERGRIQGIVHLFSRLAVVVTPGVAAFIMIHWGWRVIFFACGALGIIWGFVFYHFYRNTPDEHKWDNLAELAQIRGLNPDGTVKPLNMKRPVVPWKRILSSANMWFIAAGWCCFFFGTNFYLTWYPTYLRQYRHMSLLAMGIFGAFPLLAGMGGDLLGGVATDKLLERTGSAKIARRGVAIPGFVLAGLFVIPAAVTTSPIVCILSLAASFFCLEVMNGVAWSVCMDVGGQYSGAVSGVMNMCGAFAASLTPIIYGAMFQRGMWIAPFFVTAGVFFAGALMWLFFINPDVSVVDAPGQPSS